MASHEEIWDDSALVNSWNEALAEYKKYHSIHAQGAALPEDVAGELKDQNAKPSAATPDAQQKEVEEGEAMEEDVAATAAVEVKIIESQQPPATAAAGSTATAAAASLPGPGPQLMLGSVQDEELKKLLMSWYYAGYYTGLYEGKQKALQEQQQAQE
ncbi:hypothetical protein B0T20DRAFT_252231 [Sordaria brevicollis]|uniref:Survival Motor Neuron Gemin2-binding domain-containing protein n=1 Tax=Sordaria brevicollis TaxID=83679 RepID=A0AAE0PCB5_SORBR|nr:hypothetical protein B0T20DRAFT_252231 [Sordaria brevicollis]